MEVSNFWEGSRSSKIPDEVSGEANKRYGQRVSIAYILLKKSYWIDLAKLPIKFMVDLIKVDSGVFQGAFQKQLWMSLNSEFDVLFELTERLFQGFSRSCL